MKQRKTCDNCIRGMRIPVNDDILCREKGAVSPDYVCTRHKQDPMSNYRQGVPNKCAECEYFIGSPDSHEDGSMIGLCRLFSVRQYDGTRKKACSKFSRKYQAGAS